MFAIFLCCIVLSFFTWLVYQPDAHKSKRSQKPAKTIVSNDKAENYYRYPSNGKSDSVLLTVSIEVPKGQEAEKIEVQGNGRTVLLANESQSNGNGKTNSVLVKISIEMPKEQELKKHDHQTNQVTALVANGHQSTANGNGNNGNQGSSNGHLAIVNTAPEVKVEPTQVHPPKPDDSNGNNGNQSSSNGHLAIANTAPEVKVEPTQVHPPKQDNSNGHNGNQSSSNGHLAIANTAPEVKVEPTQVHPPKQDNSNGHNGNQSSSNGHLAIANTAPEVKIEPTQVHPPKQDNSNGHNGNQSSSNGHLAIANTAPEVKVEPTQVHPPKPDDSNGGSVGTETTIPLPNGGSIQLPDEAESIATPPSPEKPQFDKTIINETLQQSRQAITGRIMQFIDFKRDISGGYAPLYEMLKDYPFRKGKMLRPTMCISAARAMGGMGDRALTTAAALELYHNAFLIHDDIEDGSESRRGKETLHHAIGIARAINVGDATNVLAVGLLLENLSAIGIQKTLNVLHEIEFMAQQSVEGQAMELDWVANNTGHLTDQDYFTMCVKKTCWYTFMTPLRIGLIIGHPTANLTELVKPLADITRFGMILGIAFQIQDDLLNILGDLKTYGKEIGGDIYEGKRTIMLNHVIANSNAADRILEILALPREQKTPEQIEFILEEMKRCGSIDHGWYLARTLANQADNIFESMDFLRPESPLQPGENWGSSLQDRRFLKQLINYVIYRNL
ncbi:polyprenyl synthetase family protein [Okeania sp. KiyG1]|uniref:polyprenyl synthetase family protein n=1 Tax=Okeania sp. KiyG1 TaxID=2720165 RepID=UPI001986DF4E|nr:polyprenyl synthetase family protein [Okeania sp. KiyG1]GGA34711.1 hypothetical protein CYANOKiyG1_52130 [Okeania sp. KiyG1]